ncbi:MAG: hypothetical protein ACU0CI_11590 [Shimia sp.]
MSATRPSTANASSNNEQGIATLNMLKSPVEVYNPAFPIYSTATGAPIRVAGNLVGADMWGSSLGGPTDGEAGVAEATTATTAMFLGGGDMPASTLWWDGFTISTNIPDGIRGRPSSRSSAASRTRRSWRTTIRRPAVGRE